MSEFVNVSAFKTRTKGKGFKASRFNVQTEDKHRNLLVLNTYSSRFIKIDENYKSLVLDILKRPNEAEVVHPLFKFLESKGFIVPSDTDEFRRAELLHSETISGSDHLHLILLPNEDCNFRCKYCYESFSKNFMKDWVQQAVVKYVERNIHRYKSLKVDWFGGEPLTAIPIIEKLSAQLLEICAKHRVRYSSSMTTNGYNLTLSVFKKMQKCRINTYQITLDGVKDTHDRQRVRVSGAGTFDQIIGNLRNIRDTIKSGTFKIILRTNVSGEVLDRLDEYADMISREFANDSRFTTHWPAVGDLGGDSVKDVVLCTNKDLVSPMQSASEKGVDFSFYSEKMGAGDSVCYASKRNSFIIGSDGIIYKCTVAFEDEDNQVGLIAEDGSIHLDKDKYSLWVTGHENSDQTCQKCYFRPSCQGAACPLHRIKTSERACPPVKLYIKDYMRASSIKSRRFETYIGGE